MDNITILRSAVTVLAFVTFLGIVWWAYLRKGSKEGYEEAANLPFTDDDEADGKPDSRPR